MANQEACLGELRANEKPCWFVYKQSKSLPFKSKQKRNQYSSSIQTSNNLIQPHLKMDYAKAVKGKFKYSNVIY
jgi:hypothetical protein